MLTFGKYVYDRRIELGLTLREFCRQSGFDPGNWSRIEQGINNPTLTGEWIKKVCTHLKIEKGSDEHQTLLDLAYLANGKIPDDIREKVGNDNLLNYFGAVRGNGEFSRIFQDGCTAGDDYCYECDHVIDNKSERFPYECLGLVAELLGIEVDSKLDP